jgi:ribonucleoside-diphosphate reductase alpha chain
VADLKERDFNWPGPLDMTNISLNYDDDWLNAVNRSELPIFVENVRQALRTGEPGFSFNFGDKGHETLRNACTEISSADDSDVCNLGSLNLGRIDSLEEFIAAVELGTKFLLCGTLRAKLPYQKVYDVRNKNRRLGLGLMGIHEWLIKRGQRYQVDPELKNWLAAYRDVSAWAARSAADALSISRPVAVRAIAPTGTIGILAGTSTGIEPIFATAYKRRYLTNGTDWHYEYVVDGTAQEPKSFWPAVLLAVIPAVCLAFGMLIGRMPQRYGTFDRLTNPAAYWAMAVTWTALLALSLSIGLRF